MTFEEEKIVKEYYEYSKELMQDLFMNILPNQEIKDILLSFILDEKISSSVKEIQVIAETDIIKTESLIEKLQNIERPKNRMKKSTIVTLLTILLLDFLRNKTI